MSSQATGPQRNLIQLTKVQWEDIKGARATFCQRVQEILASHDLATGETNTNKLVITGDYMATEGRTGPERNNVQLTKDEQDTVRAARGPFVQRVREILTVYSVTPDDESTHNLLEIGDFMASEGHLKK